MAPVFPKPIASAEEKPQSPKKSLLNAPDFQ
jgi:hypothetical protein